jgi:hypothetical protein
MEWECYLYFLQGSDGASGVCYHVKNSMATPLETAQACAGFKHVWLLLLRAHPSVGYQNLPSHPEAVGAAWDLRFDDYFRTSFSNSPNLSVERDVFNAFRRSNFGSDLKQRCSPFYLARATITLDEVDGMGKQSFKPSEYFALGYLRYCSPRNPHDVSPKRRLLDWHS